VIRVQAVLDGEGCLSSVLVSGHAAVNDRTTAISVVCAAVTGVVRSCADAIARRQSIVASGSADAPGELRLEIHSRDADGDWLRGVTDVMLCGIGRMADEAPDDVELRIERTGEYHGAQEGRWKQ
jgi:uncharacterized protein YsxB (DUF464 family)